MPAIFKLEFKTAFNRLKLSVENSPHDLKQSEVLACFGIAVLNEMSDERKNNILL